jgi:transketolase
MNLNKAATEIRKKVIEMAHSSKGAHVGSSLSCVDILTVLYFKEMKLDPWDERDIFILSKGHSAMALYATLAEKGIIDKEILKGYYRNNGTLPAHLDKFSAKGIEVSSGALGHGFNMGIGIAYGLKKKKSKRRVFAIIGDGESQEGSIWEGALFAPRLGVDNFTAILDYNNLQGYGCPRDICEFEPVKEKWKAFGWTVLEADGHDHKSIEAALKAPRGDRPKIIIARTTKGKGVSFMENQLVWHYYIVTEEFREKALKELNEKFIH